MPSYNPRQIEPRWQKFWDDNATFRTPEPGDPSVAGKPKYYILDMFPYPSGSGLHVGHPEGYTATDILARYKRMRGFHVLHPMGWDAFGLPAEQHAVNTGVHPRINTQENINNFRRQIKSLGFSYDWDREVDTTDPKYFRWTQWIFLQLFDTWYDHEQGKGRAIAELPIPGELTAIPNKALREKAVRDYVDGKRLAYQSEVAVNWCPALGTVLANEEVIDGRSERGDHPVERRPLRQWMLRITEYADRLISDLESVDWPESIKEMQRNWIGRSEGAEVDFRLAPPEGHDEFPLASLGHDTLRRITEEHKIACGSRDGRQALADKLRAAGVTPSIRVFTTRPDTLFGATYMVLAPEHPLVPVLVSREQAAAASEYVEKARNKSERERTELTKQKTGVFTGAFALNPVNGERIPIWIADYVLGGYGTGAIMAVPAHDERDFEFARAFGLPIRTVVRPSDAWLERTKSTLEEFTEAYTEPGTAMNSGEYDGLSSAEFKAKITSVLESRGGGNKRVNYRLRDWLFSRQRYWGEPFPILHELEGREPTGRVFPVLDELLPLRLPEVEDFRPTGNPEPTLEKAKDWVWIQCGDEVLYKRETNTMPQWAGSCWYFLRYIDPHNEDGFADPEKLKHWLPVDLYVGGAEHAVLHLLYSRFWHKVLFDRGHVPCPEPFQRLVNQGMILGEMEYHITPESYEDHKADLAHREVIARHIPGRDGGDSGSYVLQVNSHDGADAGSLSNLPDDLIEKREGRTYLKGTGLTMTGRSEKMSKSRGNVINPDDVVSQYGADSLRLYEMFMGPLEATKPWNMRSVEGVYRFLSRVWRLTVDDRSEEVRLSESVRDVEPDRDTLRHLHLTIQKVTEDTEGLRFNTAIAAMMEFVNFLTKLEARPRPVMEAFVKLLAPYAPHAGEELWRAFGHEHSVAYEPWPEVNPDYLKVDEVEIPVSVNGKLRSVIRVSPEISSQDLERAALADEKVGQFVNGQTVRKVIVKPGQMVNIVVAG